MPKPDGSKQEPEKPADKPKDGVLRIYKKKADKNDKHAQSRRMRSLSKFKKSLQGALGSLGRKSNNVKQRKSLDNVFQEFQADSGWEIFHAQDYDKPSGGPIKVKHIEKRPAYAFNQNKGQLIMLPEYDRVIVTQDGKCILEDSVTTIQKFHKQSSSSETSQGEDDLEDFNVQKLAEERKEQRLAEMQFEQVRAMNKKFIKQESQRRRKLPEDATDPVPIRTSSTKSDEIDQLNKDLAQHVSIDRQGSKQRRYKPKGDFNLDINKNKHKILRKGDKQKLYVKDAEPDKTNPVYESECEDNDEDDTVMSPIEPSGLRLEDSGYRSEQSSPATPMMTTLGSNGQIPVNQVLWPPPQGAMVPMSYVSPAPLMGVSMSYTPVWQAPQPFAPQTGVLGMAYPANPPNIGDENNNVIMTTTQTMPSQSPQNTPDNTLDRHKQLVIGPIGYRPVNFNPQAASVTERPASILAQNSVAPPGVLPGRKSSQDSGTAGMGDEEAPVAPPPLYPQIV